MPEMARQIKQEKQEKRQTIVDKAQKTKDRATRTAQKKPGWTQSYFTSFSLEYTNTKCTLIDNSVCLSFI